MKIAIMTQPLGQNYGGIIQAWALQQVLKGFGHEPVTIDRQLDSKGPIYHTARFGHRFLQNLMGKRKGPLSFERYLPDICQSNYEFIKRNLRMSEPVHSTDELIEHFNAQNYNAVIVGSDQTWRPCYSPNIGNFFLDFLQDSNIKRIAYAASFGTDEWEFTEQQTQYCAQFAKKFDAITVREDSGVVLCDKYLRVNAEHVLDPTLLVKKEAYKFLYETKDIPTKQGVYTYILDQANWKTEIVETVMEVLNRPQYNNQPKSSMSNPDSGNLDDYSVPSIEGWLKGFSDADFVVTDSFHGTVFAVIFNKPFVSLVNTGRGASRLYSFAEVLGLSDRLQVDFNREMITKLLNSPIDFEVVTSRLDFARASSEKILMTALNK